MLFTYKTQLLQSKPYFTDLLNPFLAYLNQNLPDIASGAIAVWLAREIDLQGQRLYFPFLDIDGTGDSEDEKIRTAILSLQTTLISLDQLGAKDLFTVIATGGTGFRLVGSILVTEDDHQGFLHLIEQEFPQIIDLKPTKDLQNPHQLFVYKGNPDQTSKEPVDRHSVVISHAEVLSREFGPDQYRLTTAGKPNPTDVIQWTQNILSSFHPVTDLGTLGKFGQKISEHRTLAATANVDFFEYRSKAQQGGASISLEAMKEFLTQRGIECRVEKRGRQQAISFKGLPCPICKSTTSNAVAYPPSYYLRCHHSDCAASNAVPLSKWIDTKAAGLFGTEPKKPPIPKTTVSIKEAHDLIAKGLDEIGNTVIVVTPGVGKTHSALKHLATQHAPGVIIYSSLNRDLKNAAAEEFHKHLNGSTVATRVLGSRDELCLRRNDASAVSSQGYSPGEILCRTCPQSSSCPYILQRQNLGAGIYFVTHQMLPYLDTLIPTPDLIILDENVVGGFLQKDTCTDANLRSLHAILDAPSQNLLTRIQSAAVSLSGLVVRKKSQAQILNGRKLRDISSRETGFLEYLARTGGDTEDDLILKIEAAVKVARAYGHHRLHSRNVSFKALEWLENLCTNNSFSSLHFTTQGDIAFNSQTIMPFPYPTSRVKILDATGDKDSAGAVLGRHFNEVRADVAWTGHLVHIKRGISRGELRGMKDLTLKKLLGEALFELSANDVLLITYKEFEDKIVKLCQSLAPAKTFHTHHFHGPRGGNDFSKLTAALVVGLPFPNPNERYQQAHVLFPGDKQEDDRAHWVDRAINDEITQAVHRIRPVRKSADEKVELVLIGASWPSALPSPIKTIEHTREEQRVELAICRLEPLVQRLGFFNPDVGFMAGVYIKGKEQAFLDFSRSLRDVSAALQYYLAARQTGRLSQFSCSNNLWFGGNSSSHNLSSSSSGVIPCYESIIKMQHKSIQPIKISYWLNLLRLMNDSFQMGDSDIYSLWKLTLENKRSIDNPLVLPNTKQMSAIRIHFQEKYRDFSEFKLKLPHSRGNHVVGVGAEDRVRQFYAQLSSLQIFGSHDLNSLQSTTTTPFVPISIPPKHVVVYVPEKQSDLWTFGYANNIVSGRSNTLATVLSESLQDSAASGLPTVITNDGKTLANALLQMDRDAVILNDVILQEQVLFIGETAPPTFSLADVFERQGLDRNYHSGNVCGQLYESWKCQREAIGKAAYVDLMNLETQVLWVTAKMEGKGFYVDSGAILDCCYELESKKASGGLTPPAEHRLGMIRGWMNRIDSAGMYRDTWKQMGTATGRFTSSLHTVPKDGPYRGFFRARPAYKLVIADYGQQEVRVIAGLSKDANLLKIILSGRDPYVGIGMELAGVTEQKATQYRSAFKDAFLELCYGAYWESVMEELERTARLTGAEAYGFVTGFTTKFPGLHSWQATYTENARNSRFASTILGRRRKVSPETKFRSLLNFPVQGTAAEGFKVALTRLDQQLTIQKLDARIVHHLHDEIVVEAKEEIVNQVATVVKECMEGAYDELLPKIPFIANPEIRDTWGKPEKTRISALGTRELAEKTIEPEGLDISFYSPIPVIKPLPEHSAL